MVSKYLCGNIYLFRLVKEGICDRNTAPSVSSISRVIRARFPHAIVEDISEEDQELNEIKEVDDKSGSESDDEG